ncbi:MFS transporter [Streptomyces sp. AP-93]|uniref:MFS transporter n=1 Tax=Streptomyces sp. AP-93 TaxID=2929048 RepID=UPI001FAF2ECF|nr:MFS transporter [Streptomyces sp. AP-93]MCJ0871910.1 MFS transporter [Streptomyces sp. AP-93]
MTQPSTREPSRQESSLRKPSTIGDSASFRSRLAMPAPVFALVLAVFGLGTAESVIAGLLPRLSEDLQVSLSDAGLLVSGYALTVVVGGPLVTLVTSRLPRRPLLVGLLAVFTAGNLAAALAPGYEALMAARVASALSHCTLFAISLVTAAEIAGPEKSGSAVARIIVGVNLSTIVGVPLGLLLAQQWGWRAAFWGVVLLSLVALVAVAVLVPRSRTPVRGDVGAELRVLRDRRVQVALLLTVVAMTGGFAAFTFLTPVLEQVSGFGPRSVTLLLFLFGLGSLAGGMLGGRLADRALMGSLTAFLGLLTLVLLAFAAFAALPVAAVAVLVAFSVLFFALNPGLGARILNSAGDRAPTIAVSVSIAAVQASIALGAWLGGRVLDAGFGLTAVFAAGAVLTFAAGVIAWFEWRAGLRPAAPSGSASSPDVPAAHSGRDAVLPTDS